MYKWNFKDELTKLYSLHALFNGGKIIMEESWKSVQKFWKETNIIPEGNIHSYEYTEGC